MSHYKEICIDCKGVISQCRCPDANKPTRLGVCQSCQEKRNQIAVCKETTSGDDERG